MNATLAHGRLNHRGLDGPTLLVSCVTAARLLGVGPWALATLCRSGELPAGRIGEQWVIAAEDVRDFATKVTRQG